jgi:peroxiredoxin
MGHIRKIMPEFDARDFRVLGILAQDMKKVQEYMEGKDYPFPLLVDEKRTLVKEYGVHVKANFESYNIARPSDFVLDTEGTIRYFYVGSHQMDFPKDEELFEVLEEIAKAS